MKRRRALRFSPNLTRQRWPAHENRKLSNKRATWTAQVEEKNKERQEAGQVDNTLGIFFSGCARGARPVQEARKKRPKREEESVTTRGPKMETIAAEGEDDVSACGRERKTERRRRIKACARKGELRQSSRTCGEHASLSNVPPGRVRSAGPNYRVALKRLTLTQRGGGFPSLLFQEPGGKETPRRAKRVKTMVPHGLAATARKRPGKEAARFLRSNPLAAPWSTSRYTGGRFPEIRFFQPPRPARPFPICRSDTRLPGGTQRRSGSRICHGKKKSDAGLETAQVALLEPWSAPLITSFIVQSKNSINHP